MCNYKVLAHNEDGYVILCHSCRHYQLAFGTTAVTFEPARFKRFCERVEELKQNTGCNGFEAQKRISLDLACSCVLMMLSYNELTKLNSLLQQALFDDELETLLENLNLVRE